MLFRAISLTPKSNAVKLFLLYASSSACRVSLRMLLLCQAIQPAIQSIRKDRAGGVVLVQMLLLKMPRVDELMSFCDTLNYIRLPPTLSNKLSSGHRKLLPLRRLSLSKPGTIPPTHSQTAVSGAPYSHAERMSLSRSWRPP